MGTENDIDQNCASVSRGKKKVFSYTDGTKIFFVVVDYKSELYILDMVIN